MRTITCFTFLAMLLLLPVGCSSNDVINSLELAVNAVSVVVDLAGPSAGLPPDVTAQVKTYAAATATALEQSIDILDGPGTDAQKGAAIAAAFAGIAVPVVPPKYQGIASAVQQVSLLVSKFLAQAPATRAAAGPPAFASAFADPPAKKSTRLSKSQRAKLAKLKVKAAAAAEAAKKKP